ncbi:MAG: cytochrome c oxidase subunit 3 [Rhodomicrobium sp.]
MAVQSHLHEAAGHEAHAHEWHWSWAPAAISVGILLLCFAVSMFFVYEAKLAAIIFAGVGTPLILGGIANWMGSPGVTGPTQMYLNSLTLTLFIFSEGAIFFAMFIAYYYLRIATQVNDQPWPPAGTPEINQVTPLIALVALVASSLVYHMASKSYQEGGGGFTILLLLAIILGAVFVGGTFYEWSHLSAEGFKPGTNVYSTPFYALTGVHVAHVIVGLGAFLVILFGSLFGKVHESFVKLAGVYWYFVTLASFFVVTQVYFW